MAIGGDGEAIPSSLRGKDNKVRPRSPGGALPVRMG